MNEFHLLIDDFRTFKVDHISRNGKDGLQALLDFPVTHLYMDHDLGDDSSSGYEVIILALLHDVVPNKVLIVSNNPPGRDNIARALESNGYSKKGKWYEKN